ncbi:hypothetical protein N7519_006131 [Penicillium mononematosum]|uniref:uncharacterized protein n=1 Tax=Penicillium mononematosum TaxID=268346 RepID=UPI0025496CAE|nr:uncharacterized protein N7519_006131 [Penicillium mononematosum]KAJ6184830.1 hypothetical protein N7519_006131 [Penicillium mononematosum]
MSLSFFLSQGSLYAISVLIDHMGQDEEAPGTDATKFLRGEQYQDLARGPLNEVPCMPRDKDTIIAARRPRHGNCRTRSQMAYRTQVSDFMLHPSG